MIRNFLSRGLVSGIVTLLLSQQHFAKNESQTEPERGALARQNPAQWMKFLKGNLPISTINLPGSHDSAAIVKGSKLDRQNLSISEQLHVGLRVLDVRIAIIKSDTGKYSFQTTHGGGSGSYYQSLPTLLDEVQLFLEENPSEFVVVIFQADEGDPLDVDANSALLALLYSGKYSLFDAQMGGGLPCVESARGKMFLLNRLNEDYKFGIPLTNWVNHQNCHFLVANEPKRDKCRIFVQDRFKKFHVISSDSIEGAKFDLFINSYSLFNQSIAEMSQERKDQSVLINYASVSLGGSRAVLNTKVKLLNYLGNPKGQLDRLGWVMMDFPTETWARDSETGEFTNLVEVLIASNFGYKGVPPTFRIR